MHIVIATGTFPPDTSGPARYTKILSEELPKHGVNVSVVSFGLVRHLPRFVRHIVYTWKLLSAVTKDSLLYAQDPVSVGLPTLVVHFLTRSPYVVKIVGDYAWEQGMQRFGVSMLPDEFVATKQESFFVRALQYVQKLVAQKAKKIIVPSVYLKKIVGAWGIAQEKITVVHNAFDASLPAQSKEVLQEKLHIESQSLISVGRFVPWKGFLKLLAAFREVQKKFPKAMLRIVGEGPDRNMIAQKIQELGLNKSVVLTGALSQSAVLECIKASDVFVLNTGYEGLSHLLLEAMALGTPIVTTDVGGNTELIENGISGILVAYNDVVGLCEGMERILADHEFAVSLREHAQDTVKSFNKERMLAGILEILLHKNI